MVGELYAATAGIGFDHSSRRHFQTDKVFVSVLSSRLPACSVWSY
jgi:ABC-type nitrate/sulfonate/bicarbonate transport system permease component